MDLIQLFFAMIAAAVAGFWTGKLTTEAPDDAEMRRRIVAKRAAEIVHKFQYQDFENDIEAEAEALARKR